MRMFNMLRAMDAFTEHDSGGVEEVAQAAPVTCPTCGAPVEDDALEAQTMPEGSLMWPQPFCRPFCRVCLLAVLRRLDAELWRPRAAGEDGE